MMYTGNYGLWYKKTCARLAMGGGIFIRKHCSPANCEPGNARNEPFFALSVPLIRALTPFPFPPAGRPIKGYTREARRNKYGGISETLEPFNETL